MSHGDSRRVVIAALIGNAGIAICKFVAAYFSQSSTMLAEGVHSLADTSNQALLLVGIALSKRVLPELYPMGRHKESYFWPFVVSLLLFFMGGVFAVKEGIHKLLEGESHAPSSLLISVAVLVVSLALESGSFFVALREFNKGRSGRSFRDALFTGKDPTIPLVLLEDAAAVLGLVLALLAVLLTWFTGNSTADALGSILIGVLLCGVGLVLAKDTRSLLLGEGITPFMRDEVLSAAREAPHVQSVTQLLSMHLGPNDVLLALKVRFSPTLSLPELERVIDDLEGRINARVPQMTRIFVEPDSDYDATRDPALTPSARPPA